MALDMNPPAAAPRFLAGVGWDGAQILPLAGTPRSAAISASCSTIAPRS